MNAMTLGDRGDRIARDRRHGWRDCGAYSDPADTCADRTRDSRRLWHRAVLRRRQLVFDESHIGFEQLHSTVCDEYGAMRTRPHRRGGDPGTVERRNACVRHRTAVGIPRPRVGISGGAASTIRRGHRISRYGCVIRDVRIRSRQPREPNPRGKNSFLRPGPDPVRSSRKLIT